MFNSFEYIINQYDFKNKKLLCLDLGCGEGDSLKLMGKRGLGIDDRNKALKAAKRKGIQVVKADLNSPLCIESDICDVVILKHVLEHFHNPIRVLCEVNRILKLNGKLILGLPMETPLMEIYRVFYRGCGYFQIGVDSSNPYGHIYSFSPQNAKSLLNKTGFDVIGEFYNVLWVHHNSPTLYLILQKLPSIILEPLSISYWLIGHKICSKDKKIFKRDEF